MLEQNRELIHSRMPRTDPTRAIAVCASWPSATVIEEMLLAMTLMLGDYLR